jgi:hypothetical protein
MGQGIQFGTLGAGFNNGSYNPVRALFYDTLDKKLYAGGQFALADGKTVWGAAVWYNNHWDSLRGGFTQFPQIPASQSDGNTYIWKITRFQNKIYFVGGIVWVNGKNQYHMGVWNGSNWDYPIAEPPNAQILDLKVHNGNLYACGDFTKFGNTTCNYVAKYDGNTWKPVGDFTKYYKTYGPPARMQCLEFFNNELYVGGYFSDSTGTSRNLAKFDGTNWVNVGTGIRQGGVNGIQALQTFNSKLYIGGYFSRTNEIPGSGLVVWNGNTYEGISDLDLLDSGNGYVTQFTPHKNKLFVSGAFTKMGSLPVTGFFYLENDRQCAFKGMESTLENPENVFWEPMVFMSDSLVLGGLFKHFDTVSANNIVVMTNYESNSSCVSTNISENIFGNATVRIYPNPVEAMLNIEFESIEYKKLKLSVSNSVGEIVYSSFDLKRKQEIDLSFLTQGIYFLKMQINSSQKTFKIIIN